MHGGTARKASVAAAGMGPSAGSSCPCTQQVCQGTRCLERGMSTLFRHCKHVPLVVAKEQIHDGLVPRIPTQSQTSPWRRHAASYATNVTVANGLGPAAESHQGLGARHLSCVSPVGFSSFGIGKCLCRSLSIWGCRGSFRLSTAFVLLSHSASPGATRSSAGNDVLSLSLVVL